MSTHVVRYELMPKHLFADPSRQAISLASITPGAELCEARTIHEPATIRSGSGEFRVMVTGGGRFFFV